jgi:hypothetical protein
MRKELIKIPFLKLYSPPFYFKKGEDALVIIPKQFPSSIYNIQLYSTDSKLKSVKHLSFLNDMQTEKIDIRGYSALRIVRPTLGLKCLAEVLLFSEETL